MRYISILPVLSVWWASVSVGGQGILRNHQQTPRPWRQDPKNPKARKSPRRELQRVASLCTNNPTPFSTSLFVTLIGDGTPFEQEDLNTLLRLSLTAFNEADAASCDTTYRTLTAASVGNVYYTEELDYIQLRFDVNGSCAGCLPTELESGIGPLFGNAERRQQRELLENHNTNTQEEQQSSLHATATTASRSSKKTRRIKGGRFHSERELKNDKNDKDSTDTGNSDEVPAFFCGCNIQQPVVVLRGPTPSEFGILLNSMIATARSDNALSGVSYVEDIFEAGVAGRSTVLPSAEARQVAESCTEPNNQDFTTTVWLEVIPTSPTIMDLTEAEKLPLEVALLETFNSMNLMSCDLPYFRIVSDVTHRETRRAGDNLQLRFDVGGRCVNCDPNTLALFDDTLSGNIDVVSVGRSSVLDVPGFRPPSRSRLVSEIQRLEIAQAGPVIILREVSTSCACPLNTDALPLRSPTTGEFAQTLQTTIETLSTAGYISSIQEVVRVQEGEIDPVCPADVSTFVSTILVDFAGEPEKLTPPEVLTLEGGFKDTYNDLIFNSCDEYFRTIVDVRLIPGVARRRRNLADRLLQATSVGNAANSSDVPDLQSEAPSVYMVTGECRACPRSSSGTFSLIDDGFRFRKLMEGGVNSTKEEITVAPHYSYASVAEAIRDFMSVDMLTTTGTSVIPAQRRLQDCACAPGARPDSPFAPKPDDFRLAYNEEIVKYNEDGSVVNVQEVTALVEVPPGVVTVGFSIFYGTLDRIGNAIASDYPPLVRQTAAFYRTTLIANYTGSAFSLRAVNVVLNATTPREDLHMLQVAYTAELLFEDAPDLPTPQQVTEVMEELDYVDYITDFVWSIDPAESVFRGAHSVRYAGQEDLVVEMRLLFTVATDRTDQSPNTQDRSGLRQQVSRFYLDVLRNAGFKVVSFTAHVDAEDVFVVEAGSLLVDFDGTIVFSKEVPPPSLEEVNRVLQSADLEVLRTQYLGTTDLVGTTVFSDSFQITLDAP